MLQVGEEEKETVRGAHMRDMLTGQEWDVRAKMVVNATGGEWRGRERQRKEEGEGEGRGKEAEGGGEEGGRLGGSMRER